MNKVAVYGTLKEWFHNHSVMQRAEGTKIGMDYVEVESLHNVWYPCVKFKEGTNRFLEIEVYYVPDEWMQNLDWLEWYTPGDPNNLYNRITVTTHNWDEVIVYEINSDIDDWLEEYFDYESNGKRYYNWVD